MPQVYLSAEVFNRKEKKKRFFNSVCVVLGEGKKNRVIQNRKNKGKKPPLAASCDRRPHRKARSIVIGDNLCMQGVPWGALELSLLFVGGRVKRGNVGLTNKSWLTFFLRLQKRNTILTEQGSTFSSVDHCSR